jgi:hypothetical protein
MLHCSKKSNSLDREISKQSMLKAIKSNIIKIKNPFKKKKKGTNKSAKRKEGWDKEMIIKNLPDKKVELNSL